MAAAYAANDVLYCAQQAPTLLGGPLQILVAAQIFNSEVVVSSVDMFVSCNCVK